MEVFERFQKWFSNQSNPVKAGIIIGTGILIILIVLIIIGFVFDDSPLSGAALDKYKASCTEISFLELNNNPSKFQGQHVKFTGQIVRINENNGRTEIVMAVTPITGGWSSSDLIYVTYNSKTQFKQGDVITIYGAVSGTYNYVTSNGQVKIPKIIARYIELTPIITPVVVPVPFTSPTSNISNNSSNTSQLTNTSTPTNPTNTQPNTNPSNAPV
jgi:starvation-inducible outer membrane lipoprotein